MSTIDKLSISVFPCANGGYMVVAVVQEKEKDGDPTNRVPDGIMLFGMQRKPLDQIRIYAPDSQHVGMAIQEIIDNATVKSGAA